jgi:mannose-6-phosphate isomerase-like protein (cupin superfamily)
MKTSYREIPAYITKDGSEIRELMHPILHGNHNQSLAEAIVPAGMHTQLHRHHLSEEIYHVTAGSGIMTLGAERFSVAAGDTVLILPGTPHRVEATGSEALRILCSCSPAYSHDDTELIDAA